MASIHSVRAHHLSVHVSPHLAHELRRVAVLTVTIGVLSTVVLRAGTLVPGIDSWVRRASQNDIFLGIVVLTVGAIALAVKAASDFSNQHEEHDVR